MDASPVKALREFTREQPGCFHSLMEYMAHITGQPERKSITVRKLEHLYRNPNAKKKQLKYDSYYITAISDKGERRPFRANTHGLRFDIADPEFILDHFEVEVYKSPEDFGLVVQKAGTYKDCLGGGWTCSGPMLSINGQFFAPEMECAHGR